MGNRFSVAEQKLKRKKKKRKRVNVHVDAPYRLAAKINYTSD
jgi:hypothetical protein